MCEPCSVCVVMLLERRCSRVSVTSGRPTRSCDARATARSRSSRAGSGHVDAVGLHGSVCVTPVGFFYRTGVWSTVHATTIQHYPGNSRGRATLHESVRAEYSIRSQQAACSRALCVFSDGRTACPSSGATPCARRLRGRHACPWSPWSASWRSSRPARPT